MARRKKRLVDVVRDGTFVARKDERLLAGRDQLPWPGLESCRVAYLAADGDRRDVALELERELREPDGARRLLGDLQTELLRLGPRDSFEQLEAFFPWAFRHRAGPRAGQPFVLDAFQRDYLREFWRRDKHGRRVYTVGLLGIPKGNGKTPLAAALGTHALVSETDAPEVYGIAGSSDQARIAHDFAQNGIEGGPLAAWLEVGSVITCAEHGGEYMVQSSEGDLGHGVQPSAGIGDELWLFRHRAQREAYRALAEALDKRPGRAWLQGISSAGYTLDSLLGETYQAVMVHPRLELHNGGFLRVLRDEESGFLMHWYGVPDGVDVDIEDPAVVRACNPAPWVDPADLIRGLQRPDTDEYDWRRLRVNEWTRARDTWLASGIWAGLRSDAWIPEGADCVVAVDAATKHDTTAVAWGGRLEDGRVAMRCRVWSCRHDVPHHVFVPGGRIDNELAFRFILDELGERYRIREVVGDPRFFDVFLLLLARHGLTTAEFSQGSPAMNDAVEHFYEAAKAGTIAWDDPESPGNVFAQHVGAAAAVPTKAGWRLVDPTSPIDALTAAIMLRERVVHAPVRETVAPWTQSW